MRIFTKSIFIAVAACFSLMYTSCKEEDAAVTAKTGSVINASASSGTFLGTVEVSGTNLVETGIVYSSSVTYPKITNSRRVAASSSSMKDFEVIISGLRSDSTYRYRTYATTSDTTYYGTSLSFLPTNPTAFNSATVSGGKFKMGATTEQAALAKADESPAHDVTLSSFLMGKFEVTNVEFARFLKSRCVTSGGSAMCADGSSHVLLIENLRGLYYDSDSASWILRDKQYTNYPMVNVTWYGAQEYCRWAGGRLPTEAEWEFAAREGSSARGFLYSGSNTASDVAWFNISPNSHENPVHLGGLKEVNKLGIYDMTGNVWEWVYDWYDTYTSAAQTNPTGISDDEAENADNINKVRRGGCWADTTDVSLRVSCRASSASTLPTGTTGFRMVKDVE